MIGGAVMAPIWGRLADRHGRKLMVLRATCGAMTVIALTGLVRAPWQLLALRAVQGFITGVIAAVTTLVSSMVPRDRVGWALGLMQSSVYVANTISPPLGGMLADHHGYRVSAFVGASLVLITLLLTLFAVHEDFDPPVRTSRRPRMSLASRWEHLRSNQALFNLAVMWVALRLAQAFPEPVMPLFVQELGSASGRFATLTGMVNGSTALAGALAALTIGRLGDRYGYQRTLLYCLAGGAASYLPQAFVTAAVQLAILQFGLGFSVAGAVITLTALVARRSEKGQEGANLGLAFSAGFVGSATGPLLGSVVASVWSTRATLALTSALFLAAAVFWHRKRATTASGEGT
jgi:DHA1 family multidrug resistance protein-like MFS transporter